MIRMVNKMLNGGGVKSSLIDINSYNISNLDLDSSKSFYREKVKCL